MTVFTRQNPALSILVFHHSHDYEAFTDTVGSEGHVQVSVCLVRSTCHNRRTDEAFSMPQSSYYKNSKMSPALERARKAYLVPNMLTGIGVIGFVLTVYAYTIKAVSQDEFEDVPIPDGPAPSAGVSHVSSNRSTGATAVGT